MSSDDKIVEQAAEFVIENDDEKLVEWLSESPKHVGEYMRMNALWEVLADPRLQLDAARAPKRTPWIAIAATVVIAVGVSWWVTTRPETHRTTVGEVTSFALEDRSVVFLNAQSQLSVEYSETQRRIVLHAGEAVFEVAPDAERPFVVVCGDTRVTAVGTKFAVERRSGETTVAMIEGKVLAAGVALTTGQRLTVHEGVATVASVDPREVAPWRHRRLIFDAEPLAEVAAAFNRFNKPPLRIEGDALRELRISGVFAANDPESLLAYLRTLDGVEVHVEPDGTATVRSSR